MPKNLFIQQLEQIRQFVADCDRKVSVNKRRLEETQDQESLGPEALAVHQLNEQIGVKLAEAEDLGKEFVQNFGWLIFGSYGRNFLVWLFLITLVYITPFLVNICATVSLKL